MISSSIHAERPQNLRAKAMTGWDFASGTSLGPPSASRLRASAEESPESGSVVGAAGAASSGRSAGRARRGPDARPASAAPAAQGQSPRTRM